MITRKLERKKERQMTPNSTIDSKTNARLISVPSTIKKLRNVRKLDKATNDQKTTRGIVERPTSTAMKRVGIGYSWKSFNSGGNDAEYIVLLPVIN